MTICWPPPAAIPHPIDKRDYITPSPTTRGQICVISDSRECCIVSAARHSRGGSPTSANERCSMLIGSCLGMSAKRWRLGRGIDPLPSTAFPGRSSGTTNVAAAAVLVLAAVDTPSDAIGHSTDAMWRRTWRQAQHRAWHRQQALAVRRQENTANSTERELAGGRMVMVLNRQQLVDEATERVERDTTISNAPPGFPRDSRGG